MSASNKKRYVYEGKVSKWSYIITLALLIWVILDYGKILMFFTSLCIVLLILKIIIHLVKKYISPEWKAYSYRAELEKTNKKREVFEKLSLFLYYLVIDYDFKKEASFVKKKLKEVLSSNPYESSDIQNVDKVLSFYEGMKLKENFSDVYEVMIKQIEEKINKSLKNHNYELVFDLYKDMILLGKKYPAISTKVVNIENRLKELILLVEDYSYENAFAIYEVASYRYKNDPSFSIDVRDLADPLLKKTFELVRNTSNVYVIVDIYKRVYKVNLLTNEFHNEVIDKLLPMIKNSNSSEFLSYYDNVRKTCEEIDEELDKKLLLIIENSNESDFENLYTMHNKMVISNEVKKKLENKINSIIANKTVTYPYGDKKCYAEFQVKTLTKRTSEGNIYYDVANAVESTFYMMENIIEIHNLHGIKKMNAKSIVKIEETHNNIPTILFPSTGGTMNLEFRSKAEEWYFIQLVNMFKSK